MSRQSLQVLAAVAICILLVIVLRFMSRPGTPTKAPFASPTASAPSGTFALGEYHGSVQIFLSGKLVSEVPTSMLLSSPDGDYLRIEYSDPAWPDYAKEFRRIERVVGNPATGVPFRLFFDTAQQDGTVQVRGSPGVWEQIILVRTYEGTVRTSKLTALPDQQLEFFIEVRVGESSVTMVYHMKRD